MRDVGNIFGRKLESFNFITLFFFSHPKLFGGSEFTLSDNWSVFNRAPVFTWQKGVQTKPEQPDAFRKDPGMQHYPLQRSIRVWYEAAVADSQPPWTSTSIFTTHV